MIAGLGPVATNAEITNHKYRYVEGFWLLNIIDILT